MFPAISRLGELFVCIRSRLFFAVSRCYFAVFGSLFLAVFLNSRSENIEHFCGLGRGSSLYFPALTAESAASPLRD
jgi:hypothetical protein